MKRVGTIFFLVFLCAGFSLKTAGAVEELTWGDCIREAQKNHPDLISAGEAVKQQEAARKISASGQYPQVTATADASKTKADLVGGGSKTTNSYSYGVTGSQLLFDGAKTRDNVKAASENIKAAQFNYRFTSSEVRLRLRTAFVDLLKAQESLRIARDIFEIRRSNLELITLRYESGIEHRGALLTAEANLAEAQFEIMKAERALLVAQRSLNKEMGRTQVREVQASGDFTASDTLKEKPDFQALVDKNPSLGKLIAQKNAASFGIKAAQASFFPQLLAQAGVDRSGTHFAPNDDRINAGLSLSLPLFEGGLRNAQVAQAEAIFKQALENERSTKDGIILTLEQSWASLEDALQTVDVQKKFLEAAQERSTIAESQYSLGLIQFDNWTIIEDDLVSAKKAFLNTQANALLAEATWVQAKGETLEYAQ